MLFGYLAFAGPRIANKFINQTNQISFIQNYLFIPTKQTLPMCMEYSVESGGIDSNTITRYIYVKSLYVRHACPNWLMDIDKLKQSYLFFRRSCKWCRFQRCLGVAGLKMDHVLSTAQRKQLEAKKTVNRMAKGNKNIFRRRTVDRNNKNVLNARKSRSVAWVNLNQCNKPQ